MDGSLAGSPPDEEMLLDEVIPTYHFREAHGIDVRAPGEVVLGALRSLRPDDVRLLTVLLALRNLPSRLLGRRPRAWSSESPLLDQLLAETIGELADGGALILECRDRDLHSPASDVAHHRLADQLAEAGGERRARHRQLVGKGGDGPVAGGIAMNQRDRAPDLRVFERSQPAPLRRRIALRYSGYATEAS
jgi:hypothetical protein